VLDAGTPAGWVTADEVYGQDPQLRAELHRRGLGYVLAVAKSHPATTAIGPRHWAPDPENYRQFLMSCASAAWLSSVTSSTPRSPDKAQSCCRW
jgi:DDE superfamily endonuclease